MTPKRLSEIEADAAWGAEAGDAKQMYSTATHDVPALLQEIERLTIDRDAQTARAADLERQLHAEKRAYARLEKDHAVTVDAMCAYREERTQAERRERELRSAMTEAESLTSAGICVVGARGKDRYIRLISNVLDSALAATVEAEPRAGQPPQTDRKIVTLVGRRRDWRALREAERVETMAGNIVLTVGCIGVDGATSGEDDHDEEMARQCIALHFDKIDMADEIVHATHDGTVGTHTRADLDRAISLGKPVRTYQPAPPTARDDEAAT